MKQIYNQLDEIGVIDIKCLPGRAMASVKSRLSAVLGIISMKKGSSKTMQTSSQSHKGSAREKARLEPRKIWHYQFFLTDGYINLSSGAWPPGEDSTTIPGCKEPIYIWGFTDLDPNNPDNLMTVPRGAAVPEGSLVGNAKFPGPFMECTAGDDIFITVHNRGFFQKNQAIQDDISLHIHGMTSLAQYDGFPESAGCYGENLRYFWDEDWYKAHGISTRVKDSWWNSLPAEEQQAMLSENLPLVKPNYLNQAGGIYSLRNTAPYPEGIGSRLPYGTPESWSQFTYYLRPVRPGTFMYCGHLNYSEHAHMGMYGALVVRPADGSRTVYGLNTNTEYDQEYTFILSEFDPRWHRFIEGAPDMPHYYPPEWKPEIWFINGRSFPQTLMPFAWNRSRGSPESEPRYNTYIKAKPDRRVLVRYINMGYQDHPIYHHGLNLRIVGSDGFPWLSQQDKFTLSINSGETYDTITTISHISQNSPLSGPAPTPIGKGTLEWRQVYAIHDQNGYRLTTNGTYPGGMLTLLEIETSASKGKPTWRNPYSGLIEPTP